METTLDQAPESRTGSEPAERGLILTWASQGPRLEALPLPAQGELILGRDSLAAFFPDGPDGHMSRQHAAVRYDASGWHVRDLGSRNGTFVDGARVEGEWSGPLPIVLRIGEALLLFSHDVSELRQRRVRIDEQGFVVGPTLERRLTQIALAAESSLVLHMHGETGAGKEMAARRFHAGGDRKDQPFVAVNCAAIPAGLAERLLFGAKKGAYSGADADVHGYVQAADGGTLFLDEIGELDPQIQAKLLRVLETQEVLPLGASRPRAVRFGLVSATHVELRGRISDRRFREDLYFRIGRPAVAIPSLRERREEISWLIAQTLSAASAHFSLVETALTRWWPGNVRELVVELRSAGLSAKAKGSSLVRASHLGRNAGTRLPQATAPAAAAPPIEETPAVPTWRGITRKRIEHVLVQECGNISAAARTPGIHRNQLRRLMARFGVPIP